MEERVLGKTGRAVSVIGLGTWQLGADWGEVADADALATLEAAAQAGVTATYREIASTKGHDAFLVEWDQLGPMLAEAWPG